MGAQYLAVTGCIISHKFIQSVILIPGKTACDQSFQTSIQRSEVFHSPQAALADSVGTVCPPRCPIPTAALSSPTTTLRAESTQRTPQLVWNRIFGSLIQSTFTEAPTTCKSLRSSVRDTKTVVSVCSQASLNMCCWLTSIVDGLKTQEVKCPVSKRQKKKTDEKN